MSETRGGQGGASPEGERVPAGPTLGRTNSQEPRKNRLAGETSPYLLQHARNPVDWYPWGDEAFERARREDRPILLSVGYAACHWCHVMERESFEDPDIARQMNENFVCVKVDREERPDVDEIYMSVVQAMTGHGGWPMTVFLTPDARPYYGGTYFPPRDRHGMPGFPTVLQALSQAYREKKDEVVRNAAGWASQLERSAHVPKTGSHALVSWGLVDRAVDKMSSHFDEVNGGFGGPPKFPHSMDLSLFMRTYRRTGRLELMAQVRRSLDRMAAGGIYDQVGGGFHRYSVDERWLVPHFEKMLYDNALLARTYLEAHQLTGEDAYAQVARETLDYVLAEMRDPAGGFWSSQDADSEGEEGKFFVWDPGELKAVLGPMEAEVFSACYGVEDGGNFEQGKTILHRAMSAADYARAGGLEPAAVEGTLARARTKLYEARAKRVHPGTDDKVLSAWNGLMIGALADGFRVLGDPRYLDAARAAAAFAVQTMTTPEGRQLRSYRAGQAKLAGYLEDHAAMASALIDLYEASFETRWLREAQRLVSVLIEQFWDDGEGGFHFTGRDHEKLLVRTKPYQDGATPSGNSLAVTALLRLARLTGDEALTVKAERTLTLFADVMDAAPSAFAHLLAAVDLHLTPPVEIAIVGALDDPDTAKLAGAARRAFLPARVVAHLPAEGDAESTGLLPLLAGKTLAGGRPAAYVCRNRTCSAPVTGVDALEAELGRQ